MGILQRQSITNTQPLYSLGDTKTYLIVGLGNHGKKYAGTRHNIGFLCVDDFAERNEFPTFSLKKDFKCELSAMNVGQANIILIKPTTMMNLSGQAVRAVQDFYKLNNSKTLVIYDELAIKFGQVRMRVGGESAGHNGINSLMEHIGEDFGRVRVGIGGSLVAKKALPTGRQADPADFVLGKFTKAEQAKLNQITREVSSILTEFIFSGELPHDTRSIN